MSGCASVSYLIRFFNFSTPGQLLQFEFVSTTQSIILPNVKEMQEIKLTGFYVYIKKMLPYFS